MVLVFEVLRQLDVNGAEECFEDDVHEFWGLVVEVGKDLFDEALEFREVVGDKVL